MNNTVKIILIVILFAAGIAMAFFAGRLSGKNSQYPTNFDPVGMSAFEAESPSDRAVRKTKPAVRSKETLRTSPDNDNDNDQDHLDGIYNEESYPEAPQAENDPTESFRPDPYELRQIFPDNRALPPVDRDEFIAKQREKERRNRQYGQIAANKATADEIEAYYAEQTALAEDSAVILTYILTEYADRMSAEDIKKHEFLLENFEKRLERIPRKKAEALARIK